MTTAADLMQGEVVTVTPETGIPELLTLLSENQISGVPVVRSGGEVVGVVSATDVIRLASRLQEEAEGDMGGEPLRILPEEVEDDDADFYLAPSGEVMVGSAADQWGAGFMDGYEVRDIMTDAAFTVTPDTPVKDLAGFLLRGRIHRALVVEDGILKGVVTTFDLLRELAAAG